MQPSRRAIRALSLSAPYCPVAIWPAALTNSVCSCCTVNATVDGPPTDSWNCMIAIFVLRSIAPVVAPDLSTSSGRQNPRSPREANCQTKTRATCSTE